MEFRWDHFVNALVYAVLGILIYVITFRITDWISPYDLWKEIIEEHNMALAIFAGLLSLGIGIIIAAAVH